MPDIRSVPDSSHTTRSLWFWFRVAVSTFFALVTAALCVLWVRSNWWSDDVILVTSHQKAFAWSADDYLFLEVNRYAFEQPVSLFEVESKPMSDAISELIYRKAYVSVDWQNRAVLVWLPYWLSTIGAATLAAAPWILYRFSLRTLLITTTLLAMVLGFFVWAIR